MKTRTNRVQCSVISLWQWGAQRAMAGSMGISIPLGIPVVEEETMSQKLARWIQRAEYSGHRGGLESTEVNKELHVDLTYMSGVKGACEEVIREGFEEVIKSCSWGFPTGHQATVKGQDGNELSILSLSLGKWSNCILGDPLAGCLEMGEIRRLFATVLKRCVEGLKEEGWAGDGGKQL